MRIGAVITVIGMICTAVAISPLFIHSLHLPGYWWGLSMLTGLGLGIILFGLRRSSGNRRSLK